MPAGIGASLREAREQRGLDLTDVQRITKIRLRYLRAIEAERWDVLPGPAYARGFVSTYAELVDLDPAELLSRLDDEVPLVPADILAVADGRHAHDEPPASPLERTGRRRRPVLVPLLLAIAVVAGGMLAANALLGGDEDTTPEPERPAQQEAAEEEPAAQEEPEASPSEPESEPTEVKVTLTPSADVWACLVDADGEALVAGEILPAGERAGPFRSRRFELALGHGSVAVELDGEAVDVPDTPDPLGFKLRAKGAKPLEAEALPDCL